MGEVEEVQEHMKADIEAMKEQMATMMEAMMSMKKIMEANAVAVEPDAPIWSQPNESSNLRYGGQRFGKYGRPHDVQIQNEHAFLPYGLPPNYTPPNVAYTPNENVNNSTCNILEISTRSFRKWCILNDYIYISIIQCLCLYVLGRSRNSGGKIYGIG